MSKLSKENCEGPSEKADGQLATSSWFWTFLIPTQWLLLPLILFSYILYYASALLGHHLIWKVPSERQPSKVEATCMNIYIDIWHTNFQDKGGWCRQGSYGEACSAAYRSGMMNSHWRADKTLRCLCDKTSVCSRVKCSCNLAQRAARASLWPHS